MDVSIIIVNYNTKDLLRNCLKSIITMTVNLTYEIIISDNGSTDGSAEMINLEFPSVKLIENNANLGFGKANNIGAAIATGDKLFFLNTDTLLINNAIEKLSTFLDENKRIGICGGNLFSLDLKPVISYSLLFPGFLYDINTLTMSILSLLLYGRNIHFNHKSKLISVAWPKGADMMIRKSLWDKAGGFNTAFFMYYEDTELAYRVQKLGYKCVCIPEAKIIHLEGKSNSLQINKAKWMLHSRFVFMRIKYRNIILIKLNDMLYRISRIALIIKGFLLRNKGLMEFNKYVFKYFDNLNQ
jgi:GT2 family glycosyltransferase